MVDVGHRGAGVGEGGGGVIAQLQQAPAIERERGTGDGAAGASFRVPVTAVAPVKLLAAARFTFVAVPTVNIVAPVRPLAPLTLTTVPEFWVIRPWEPPFELYWPVMFSVPPLA